MLSAKLQLVDTRMSQAFSRGLIHRLTEDAEHDGRTITLDGREHLNFGSCSYLNIQNDPALVASTVDAVQRYGTQFSSSRAYIRTTLYGEVESLLEELFGVPPIVTTSTTLAHLTAVPVLLNDGDVALVDRQAHSSVQTAVALASTRGCTTRVLPHNDLAALRKQIESLAPSHRHIWYLCDSLYSMYGDFAPLGELVALIDDFPQLHLYVDDAHATGWFGPSGRGYAMELLHGHPRTVVATSFSKSFGAGGGVLLIPDPALRRLVHHCGGPLTFSGPLQPPILGALAASARLHLSARHGPLQRSLYERMSRASGQAIEYALPVLSAPTSPVCFLAVGDEEVTFALAERLLSENFWINTAMYPAVPRGMAGIRFTLTNALTMGDIDRFMKTLTLLLRSSGQTQESIHESFGSVMGRLNHSTRPIATLTG